MGESTEDLGTDMKYMDESIQIVNTIYHKYRKGVPPRKNYPNPIWLGVNLHVQHVTGLDVVGQTLESTVELEVVSHVKFYLDKICSDGIFLFKL